MPDFVLVKGGSGLFGSNLAEYLLKLIKNNCSFDTILNFKNKNATSSFNDLHHNKKKILI